MNTHRSARLAAVLGPTNTGKTHYAIERMLGHTSGMIGFPLRLLAREVYDRVVKAKGPSRVALITGEEKITPPNAQYFICTVESMPIRKPVAFMAIDEVQLAGDPQRGHVFTERLLYARGQHETLFLGSDTMRPMIRKLFPDAEIMGRERFSKLSFVPPQKLARLPRRTALVAFSANDVYALAEIMRRQKGGAAIVMGALSPRTRNAQVELYQSGEVDYLVATDAIGMGLNMDIDHVAFAATRKFDGRTYRDLTPAEMAQIAGRPGRHMNDGTFTLLADAEGGVDAQTINRIESHEFDPQRNLFWRNTKLDYANAKALIKSLERPSTIEGLNRAPDAMDMNILRALAASDDVQDMATNPAATQRLWEVCQIPDFERLSFERHVDLIHRIYGDLMSPKGVVDHDWMAKQVSRLDNVQGDIDTLAARIASIRIWTYVSHRRDWLAEGAHWAHVTRSVEDRLSDALHERLMERFLDRRTAILLKGLKAKGNLLVSIEDQNRVVVEGHFIGLLEGFSFQPDQGSVRDDHKTLQQTAEKALREEVIKRAEAFVGADAKTITLEAPNLSQPELHWNGAVVAYLVKGDNVFRPRVKLLPNTLLNGTAAEQVMERLNTWLQTRMDELLAPLMNLRKALDG
ncbi:MAG: helicase, partial [Sphingomonadales bacterium]|nr:helicase [Sphingomonadales bacterium]